MDDRHTERVIGELFSRPCTSRTELRERLASLDPRIARTLVVDRLGNGALTEGQGPLVLAIMDELGVGEERFRLTDIALDEARSPRIRMWAATALAGKDLEMMAMLVNDLGPEQLADLAENAVVELISIQSPRQAGATIQRAFGEWHRHPHAYRLMERVETCRRAMGITCAQAYGDILTSRGRLSLFERLLEFFVEEGSEEGAIFLEHLKQRSPSDDDKRAIQAALLRLRSARIDPSVKQRVAPGHALLSNCDGRGSFLVLGVFENGDETFSVSELYIRAGGGILDGLLHGRVDKRFSEQIVSYHAKEASCVFVPLTLGHAASIIDVAVARTEKLSIDESPEAQQALTLFKQVGADGRDGLDMACEAMSDYTEQDIEDLLARPEYRSTWLLDIEDLRRYGFSTSWSPSEGDGESVYQLDSGRGSLLSERLGAMAEHMAVWHHLRGDEREAGLCLAMARDVSTDIHANKLVKAIWQRSQDGLSPSRKNDPPQSKKRP